MTRSLVLTQAEEGQDGQNNDDQADEINQSMHAPLLNQWPEHKTAPKEESSGTALTENLSRVDETLSELQQTIDSVKQQAAERTDRERSERLAEERAIRDLLEKATVGGIKLELAGLGFLLVGILFASVPEFVAALLYEGTTSASPPPSGFLE